MLLEPKAARGLECRLGQHSRLREVARDQGSLADHAWAEHVGKRHARAASDERVGDLSCLAEVTDVRVAVHGERVERHDPVVDPCHRSLERRRPRTMLQRLIELPHERAVEGIHEGELDRQGAIPSGIDGRLPRERDSTGAAFKGAAPQEFGGERNQHLGNAGE